MLLPCNKLKVLPGLFYLAPSCCGLNGILQLHPYSTCLSVSLAHSGLKINNLIANDGKKRSTSAGSFLQCPVFFSDLHVFFSWNGHTICCLAHP